MGAECRAARRARTGEKEERRSGKSMGIKDKVTELLKPVEDDGYEIWNVEYAREGKEKQLRVFIDKEGGVGIDDCEAVSRFLSDKLDEADLIGEAYSLVVSSPGMDRVLLKDSHFERYAGQAVEVALYRAFEGRKKFCALLGRKTEEALYVTPIDNVTMKPASGELCVPTELVSKVSLMIVI